MIYFFFVKFTELRKNHRKPQSFSKIQINETAIRNRTIALIFFFECKKRIYTLKK